jgi:ABC-type multidrug transport system permease subunit
VGPPLLSPLSVLDPSPLLRREVEGNAYTFLTYFLAKFTSELPFTLLPTLCFSLIIYWIVDLDPSAGNYGMFIFILLEEVVCALSLGMVISAFAPTVEAAMAISAPLLTCLILFSGFYMSATLLSLSLSV